MLLLLFQLGDETYGVAANLVTEVVPALPLRPVPGAPRGIAGLLDHRGQVIPMVDLCTITLGRPSRGLLSTRCVLVNYAMPDGSFRPLGFVAEHVTETLKVDPAALQPSPLAAPATPHLGPVVRACGMLIQCVDPQKLLSPEVRAALYPPSSPACP